MTDIPAPLAFLPAPAEPRSDHLRIALLLSLCVHAAVLAIHFSSRALAPVASSALEVTLVNAQTESAPAKPQLLAQNQINGGGQANAGYAASPLPRTVAESADQQVLEALRKRQAELEAEQQQLYTQLESRQKALLARKNPDLFEQSTDPGDDNRNQESLILNAQISALKERIDRYNAQPRQQFVGPSTAASDYAQYVEAWRKKIELLGTEHYPAEARGKIHGTLQLTVYIGRDGQLLRVEMNQPSEHAVLNLAAQRIVQLAAPFPPLPPAVAKTNDVLAITRTWHFINNQLNTDTP
ncbi:protein TonB [Paralcaligenes ureilyticus]|uniref:Protein TonB n=1 Tax=Paralcaligenes ureilyticus TaxID=627131 RepID=A0A4R3M725_9BURK|nr:TonB family protein [Paralcaligenes ureilyticus]TCT09120.1 protein TonB [Paralcaligenes ureilyticus]